MEEIAHGTSEPAKKPQREELEIAAEADLFLLGECALVPFTVRKLSRPCVLWVNWSWLSRRGVEVSIAPARRTVEEWLIDRFAYCVYEEKFDEFFLREDAIFHADRYGCGEGMGPHGGSGRVATVGRYQVKGIGPTPLVCGVSNEGYVDGCLWLEEAVREAAFSELADAEFPCAAVPALAIISTGFSGDGPAGRRAEPRALLVRPALFRPAHLERASLFSSKNGKEAACADVSRTIHAHAVLEMNAVDRCRLAVHVDSFDDFLERLISQVAFGQVHRLHHGGHFSSNLAINGELNDFGSFRSVPDWKQHRVTYNSIPFGGEAAFVEAISRSFVFYDRKYGIARGVNCGVDFGTVQSRIEARRADMLAELFGFSVSSAEGHSIAQILNDYFDWQQLGAGSAEGKSTGWLFDDCLQELDERSCAVLAEIKAIVGVGNDASGTPPDASRHHYWRRAKRVLRSRPLIVREVAQGVIFHALELTHIPLSERVRGAIEFLLSGSRRLWPSLAGVDVIAQVVTEEGSALVCRRDNGCEEVVVEGALRGDRFYSFSQSVCVGGMKVSPGLAGRAYLHFDYNVDCRENFILTSISGETLAAPAMRFFLD